MIPDGFSWNQAELGNHHRLNRDLISILAFDPSGIPEPIGTGFIIAANANRATACTAAHNLTEIRDLQNPVRLHHDTSLPEFLPKKRPLRIDGANVRALCFNGVDVEMALFEWAAWDERSDIAVIGIRTQEEAAVAFFSTCLLLDESPPAVGDLVCAMGYQGMAISEHDKGGPREGFALDRRLILREGRITAVYADGHELCKRSCVVTTIPMFPGMSGGPVMLTANSERRMMPIGLISHDPEDGSNKDDRSLQGYSIVPLLRPRLEIVGVDQQFAQLLLRDFEAVGVIDTRPLGTTPVE
jgi:hypothetical protein